MRKKKFPVFLLFIPFILCMLPGCAHDTGNFVRKSEAELDAMEAVAQQANTHFITGDYPSAAHITDSQLCKEFTVSSPLYRLEKASILLMQGKNEEAHKLLLASMQDIEMLQDKKAEEKAVSLWHGEQNKVFKGDSYERATLYGLLALSFIQRGEYEEAERCVKNALLCDSTSDEKHTSDYAILQLIGYISSMKSGNRAQAEEYVREIAGIQKGRKGPVPQKDNSFANLFFQKENEPNAILCIWVGTAPSVVRLGDYGHIRTPVKGFNPLDRITFSLNMGPYMNLPSGLGDLSFQATTRGGRIMDGVLADKATAKKAAEITGNILLLAGSGLCVAGGVCIYAGHSEIGLPLLGAGLGCYVVGGIVHIVGSCINPKADVRYWKNLPCEFYLIPVRLKPGENELRIAGYHTEEMTVGKTFRFNNPDSSGKGIRILHLPLLHEGLKAPQSLKNAKQDLLQKNIIKADSSPMLQEF